MSDLVMNELSAKARSAAARLNRECFCITLDRPGLNDALKRELDDASFFAELAETRPHLFSDSPVFLPRHDLDSMLAIVRAVEAASRVEGYRDAVAAWAPAIAQHDFGPRGAFMGFDFHLGDDGPKLIEINTNAGGAFLNAFLGRAQSACCVEVEQALADPLLGGFEARVVRMFEAEHRLQGRTERPRRIAIVDDKPQTQYLYPEFVLAKRLFERNGMEAVIADPETLRYEQGTLFADQRSTDLVYNRLVDFALEQPEHQALRAVYVDGATVVTPNPRNHALFADKRNFTLLSDAALLREWGLERTHLEALSGIPRTMRVSGENADALWAGRARYFFKPSSGYGSKAVYRGDKLTKRVWSEILSADYVAQEFAPPSERTIRLGEETLQRKLDVRLYIYDGELILSAARLYQGQTTNFRTPGGGFAPVFFI